VHAIDQLLISARSGRHEHRSNVSALTLAVIVAEVASIGGRLIEVRLGRVQLALELNNHHARAHEENHIRSA
jgi:hypothetical protein